MPTASVDRILADWIHIDGVRRTAPTDSIDFTVVARAPTDQGGIKQVRFEVRQGATVVQTSDARYPSSYRKPNFGPSNSPLPGVPSGMSPLPGYGVVLSMAALPVGELTVRATAIDGLGLSYQLPDEMTFYNHRDGTLAPSTGVHYVNTATGSDSNDGLSWSSPLATIHKAIELSKNNPGGATLADLDCGGAVIYVRGDVIGGGVGVDPGSWHTGGKHWLRIVADSGATMRRHAPPFYSNPQDVLRANGAGAGTRCRIRFEGFEIIGGGPIVYVYSGVMAEAWVSGGSHHSAHWNPAVPYAVKWRNDEAQAIGFDGQQQADVNAARSYMTQVERYAAVFGFESVSQRFLYDCLLHNFLGIAVTVAGNPDRIVVRNVVLLDQRYNTTGTVAGFVQQTHGTGFQVTIPSAGIMRVTGPVGSYPFHVDALPLVGDGWWGLSCSGLPSGCNGTFAVLDAGTSGGASYVDLDNPSATPGAGTTSGATIATARLSNGSLYTTDIHPDGISIQGVRSRDVIGGVVMANLEAIAQSVYFHFADKSQLLLEDIRDDGRSWPVLLAGVNFTNSIIHRCSFNGPLMLGSGGATYNFDGTEIINSVFGTVTSDTLGALGMGLVALNNWIISGPLFGIDSRSGPIWDADPIVPPYRMAPASKAWGLGHSGIVDPAFWAWNTKASTAGCLKNIATIQFDSLVTLTVQPEASKLGAAAVNPTARMGSVQVSPVSKVGLRSGGAVVSVSASPVVPAPSLMGLAAPNPLVVLSSVARSPVSKMGASAAKPTVLLSSVLVTPQPSVLGSASVDPAVEVETPSEPGGGSGGETSPTFSFGYWRRRLPRWRLRKPWWLR